MNKYTISIALGILLLSALSLVSAVQYGMMGDNGQFYQYGMMGNNSQFTSLNQGYGGYGMMGMMQMMTGYGGYGYSGYGSGMMFLGWITYLLTIALIIAGIYWLVKTANRK